MIFELDASLHYSLPHLRLALSSETQSDPPPPRLTLERLAVAAFFSLVVVVALKVLSLGMDSISLKNLREIDCPFLSTDFC